MSAFSFDPNVGFFKLKVVRTTLLFALGWFVVSAAGYIFSAALHSEACWRIECLNYFFLTVLRVPLGGLAVIAAALALMATHHRSEQTKVSLEKTEFALINSKEQMELARAQNNFSNYFESLKQFREHMEPFGERVLDYRVLHSIVYEDPINGNFKASEQFGDIIQSCIDSVLLASTAFMEPLDEVDIANAIDSIQKAECDFYYAMKLSVSPIDDEFTPFVAAGPSWEIDQGGLVGALEEGKSTANWLSGIKDILLLVERVLTFLPGRAGSLGYILLNQVESLKAALESVPDSRISPTLEHFQPFDLRLLATTKLRELYPQ